MKKRKKAHIHVGAVEDDGDSIVIHRHYSRGRPVSFVIHTSNPYQLAWIAARAIKLLAQRKSEIENALRIAKGP